MLSRLLVLVQVASLCVGVAALAEGGAEAGPAGDLVVTELWGAVVANLTLLAEGAECVVTAVSALSSLQQ